MHRMGNETTRQARWRGAARGSLLAWFFARLLATSVALLFALVFIAASGCPRAEPPPADDPPPPAAVDLRLFVADDPPLAAAIRRLRGEWQARGGGSYVVEETTSAALLASGRVEADGVLYPARYLGGLVERGAVAPLRLRLLEQFDYRADDIFELVWQREVVWGDRPYALPLGSPQLVLYYRADLLEAMGRQPPTTWQEYDEVVEALAARKPATGVDTGKWHAAAEPLAAEWAGRMLLARAAPYARQRDHYSTLWDIQSGAPLVDGPPFVRALEEMAAAVGHDHIRRCDPAEARRAIHAGECGLAISWPTAAVETPPPAGDVRDEFEIGIAELPGAAVVYDRADAAWREREAGDDGRVPLLGVGGRLASVSAASRNFPAAQRLLAWLSGPELSRQVAATSPQTTIFRRAQLAAPEAWVERDLGPAAARQYGAAVARALRRPTWLSVPRLPGSDRYLAALDAAVLGALEGELEPPAALAEAAAAWRTIGDELGADKQRAAYRRSLGLPP